VDLIGQVFWLALPVAVTGILHMVVVKLDLFPRLRVPLDGGRRWRGTELFGPNKTWRGVVVMIVGSALIGAIQGALGGAWAALESVELVDHLALAGSYVAGYTLVNAVLGLGYALGELPNSFLKRRLAIDPGKTSRSALGRLFMLVDQADSVLAALLLGAAVFGFSWKVVIVGTLCLTFLHLFLNGAM
jgi:hypothetical protein